MLENIAMWGGVAGVGIAIIAIIILFLTKQSINHILNKDKILFDQNFEIKQKAISSAMATVDEISLYGSVIKNNVEFATKANKVYNELLCVLSDVRIADEFYNISISQNSVYNEARIAQFKLMCRKDIGLKVGKAQIVKRVLANQNFNKGISSAPVKEQSFAQPQRIEPVQPISTQPTQSAQPVRTVPTQQARPAQPAARPVQPAVKPSQPIKKTNPTNPNDSDDDSLF